MGNFSYWLGVATGIIGMLLAEWVAGRPKR